MSHGNKNQEGSWQEMVNVSFETVKLVEAYRSRCEDRVDVIDEGDRTIIVIADGAGGMGSGDVAAESVIREVRSVYPRVHTADQWQDELRQIDLRISAGESTAVVVDLRPDGILGVSVGDSVAWVIEDGNIDELTADQVRKPLLGSHQAQPVTFCRGGLAGVLIAGTDGFFDYADRSGVPSTVARTDFFAIPRTCLEMVRLPSGDLWDDFAVVACRVRRPSRSRKRYTL